MRELQVQLGAAFRARHILGFKQTSKASAGDVFRQIALP